MSNHAAKHSLAPRQDHADNHDRQNEEENTHEIKEPSAAVTELLLVLHLHTELFGTGHVQREIRFGSYGWLQRNQKKNI